MSIAEHPPWSFASKCNLVARSPSMMCRGKPENSVKPHVDTGRTLHCNWSSASKPGFWSCDEVCGTGHRIACSMHFEHGFLYVWTFIWFLHFAQGFLGFYDFLLLPRNIPVGGLATRVASRDCPLGTHACMVPCDRLASHPGCVFTSCPVFARSIKGSDEIGNFGETNCVHPDFWVTISLFLLISRTTEYESISI